MIMEMLVFHPLSASSSSSSHFVTRTTTMENKMIYRLLMLICSLKCYCCRAVDINLLPSFLPCWLFSQLSSTFIVIRSGLILLILLIVITSTAIEMGKLFRMQLFYKVEKFRNVFAPPLKIYKVGCVNNFFEWRLWMKLLA